MENDTNRINNTNTVVYSSTTAKSWDEIAKAIDSGTSTCCNQWESPIGQQDYPTFLIDWTEYKVKWISNSVEEGKKLWLNIKIPVMIYFLDWHWWSRQWAYRTGKNVIFIFDNADEITLKHEIIHSLELNKPIPDELNEFYESAKNIISEKSFDGGMVSLNFKKNIHEFIADGYSKWPFIDALKKEWLYEEFLEKTKYIFD